MKVKITNQIDTSQAIKRKEFREISYNLAESLPDSYKHKQINTQNNSIQKPLKEGIQPQISFKGFKFTQGINKVIKPIIRPIPQKLTQKVFHSLENISTSQYEYYSRVRKDYVDLIKLPTGKTDDAKELLKRKIAASFRKKNGISDEIAKNISEENLYYLPKKTLWMNFFYQLIAPFRFIYKGIEKIFVSNNSDKAKEIARQKKILKDFNSLQGLIKSHEIWENGYRKLSGHPKWTKNSDFIIPDRILSGKIKRRRNKFVDPNKGKYSSTSMMLGNRFISGIIYSYFLGTDAYNTTMRYSNDKHEASAQRSSRVAQEFSRIGLNMYIQNLLFGTFETAVNRSLASAMFVSGSTVAFSEVLGRKLVGKPIMPSDKETLDRLENEMYEKKGILPAIGKMLTNVKKKETVTKIKITDTSKSYYPKTSPNKNLFSSFCAKQNIQHTDVSSGLNKPSFKGYYKVEYLFNKNNISKIIKIVENADSKTAASLKEAILNSVKNSEYFKTHKIQIPETFDDLLNNSAVNELPVGTKNTLSGRLTSSVFVPVRFVKNIFVSAGKKIKKLYDKTTGNTKDNLSKQLDRLLSGNDKNSKAFLNYKEKMMKEQAWAKSSLSEREKARRILKEFNDLSKKEKEDIEGAKNIILWLGKQFEKENIKIREDGTLDADSMKKVRDILMSSVLKADCAKHVEYDGNTLAQTNINLSRAITTLFLMTDAYNLTMQYSNDNRKEANKSAKNRAAQEISRISVSAYILAFVHNLLSKLCNSSLAGAFTLTAITSAINDSISRQVVGVPLTAKSKDELLELDKKNAESKNPVKKALAYSIGKKTALPQKSDNSSNSKELDYFSNDFFIMPEIN